MTWGEQNSEQDAHQQLDYALEKGSISLIQRSFYAIPSRDYNQGLTGKYLGPGKNGKNDDLILQVNCISGPRGLNTYARTFQK